MSIVWDYRLKSKKELEREEDMIVIFNRIFEIVPFEDRVAQKEPANEETVSGVIESIKTVNRFFEIYGGALKGLKRKEEQDAT